MNTWTFVVEWVLAWAVLGGLIIVAADKIVVSRKQRRLVAAGVYPKPGTETDDDVQRLLAAGHRDMAIRCYATVHRLGYQESKDRLIGRQPAAYVLHPVGLVIGLAIGLALKNIGVGVGLGLLLGIILGFVMKRSGNGNREQP